VIVDDLISTGTTVVRTARRCREHGATRVYAAATHAVLASAADRALSDDALSGVIVTDSVAPPAPRSAALRDKLTVLAVAPFLAEAIRRIHEGGSLVELHESWAAAQPSDLPWSRASIT
jgi:ribose-phosphate pyrophosphokinase